MTENFLKSKPKLKEFLHHSSDEIIELLRVLDHPKRFDLLIYMLEGKHHTYQDLLENSGLKKSALANHLTTMTEKGLLIKPDKGIYQLSLEGLSLLENLAFSFMKSKIREQEKLIGLLKLVGKNIEYIEEEKLMEFDNIDEIVKVVQLPSRRVVSFHVKDSEYPENNAWKLLESWAKPKGLFDQPHIFQIFGFNNPSPSKDSEKYGYEFWITVPDDFEIEPDLIVKKHPGGLFGVMSCRGVLNITTTWNKLLKTIENSEYKPIYDVNCLEHHVDPYLTDGNQLLLDLYLPIAESDS